MKAIIFKSPGVYAYEERPKPEIKKPDDILLKILGVGICGTDLHILMNPPMHPAQPDIIFGHEFCGQVEAVGSAVTGLRPGDKVIVDPHPPCGYCDNCRSNRPEMCENLFLHGEGIEGQAATRGIFQDGGLTDYAVIPAGSAYKIHPDTPFQHMALAEPLSCTGYGIEKLKMQAGETVCILGAGPIGQLFVALAKANGATKIIVSEPHQYRREKALRCGATRVVDPTKENLKKVCLEETGGLGVDHCIEAVGQFLMTAIDMVRTGGKVLMFGHDETAAPPIKLGELVKKEVEVHGCFLGKYYFEKAARIIESGILPLDEIATHVLPLSRYEEGLELLRNGQALKVIMYPES
ncbi:alcohol dehydrogenase catalytic domain-containing protein [Christensenellaceae bacterium OttesenSCG-928-L17]|nr:alcohol dehydrogenase catalytic domain-containing protein [Christensenellaceae bacterium OttesenSCG-928-L17]